MTKHEFRQLFFRALSEAAQNAEARLGKPIPRSFFVELHAPCSPGRTVSPDEALDEIYLADDRFYRIVDVAIKEVLPEAALAFVRVSGHPPAGFSQTWDPSDLGPFKQIAAQKIKDRADRVG
ncbi:MAG: hypothetical protein ACRD9W_26380 [Terriglobia bacterium]